MGNSLKNWSFVTILFVSIMIVVKCGQNENKTTELKEEALTKDQEEVKATIERFLFVAGNYNLDAMREMIVERAMIGIVRVKDGKRTTTTLTIEEYFERVKNRKIRPYYEPVRDYDIFVDDEHLAFVRADAILHAFGVPLSNNIDYFTLMKENKAWKFLSLSFTATPIPNDERIFDLNIFGESYAQAWCSQRPDFVALFYAEDGSLTVNEGTPAVGRLGVAKVAESFMTAFPDMIVTMDSLRTTPEGTEFHWTFTGTNTGPNGTGNKVKISGFEHWQLNDQGLVKESQGTFDAEEYDRQVKYGIKN
ncbi:MAG: ester cyclase [Ignavibacterium sp.]|nr:MAG: ester cyclase [Ignavibacterium sp.]